MKVQDITAVLEQIAPLHYAEDFDNVGILVGHATDEVSGVLVTLDTTEVVVQEAIEKGCNLIISFHPIIFSGLKKLTGKTYVERAVMLAIKHGITIYATHTALDNSAVGVNYKIAEQLILKNTRILLPKQQTLKQLVTYAPQQDAERITEALCAAGAGHIGQYDQCSFMSSGQGSFRALEGANPTIGQINQQEKVAETRIEVIVPAHVEGYVLQALRDTHAYEEIAYHLIPLSNTNETIGMGLMGELEEAMDENDFFTYLKQQMNTPMIRHSALRHKKIKRVAVLGGSGSFAIKSAITAKADVFITADLKYHDFFSAENKIILADIGHFESEQFTKNLITSYLKEKFTNFVVFNSGINTNPVNYC